MRRSIWIYGLSCLLITWFTLPFPSDGYEGWLDRGEVALRQALVDLTSDMTIMCLAAHPDDEDGATLTYYRKKHGVRTAILYATRGEGGQNEIGPELYEELGVIRAHENKAAASIYGAEVYDLNRRDFGYSKSAEEAFRFWGHEDSLERLVRVIREVKPDVIITNHDTEHGHGHHQACGIMALEAFDAAADESKFPDQIRDGLKPWQVKRLFVRGSEEDADVAVNVGEYDPARGYSYAQIAGQGFGMHKSQGMGGDVRRGHIYRYYKLVRSSAPAPDKLDSLLDGLPDGAEVPGFVKDAVAIPRDRLAKDLIDYMRSVQDTEDVSRREEQSELEIAAARALDLYLSVEADDSLVTRTQEFTVRVSLTNCGAHVIEDIEFDLRMPHRGDIQSSENRNFERLGYSETATATFVVRVHNDAPLTLPHAKHLYDDLFMKPLLKGIARYKVYDTPLLITSESSDIDVSSLYEFHVLPEATIVPVSTEDQTIRYVVSFINRMPGKIPSGHIELFTPEGWTVNGMRQDFTLTEDQQGFAAFDVTIPANTIGDFSLEAKAFYSRPNDRPDIAIARSTVKAVDVKVADDLYVGYVKSYDNTLEWALKQLDVKSRALEPDDLRFGDLSVYDTILLDIRAYLVREDLRTSNQRLLDYVEDGGNLVVMYHKTFEWNGQEYAPYKLILSRDRVTVEEAPITILAPDHPLLLFPNRITSSDWEGWIQERGLYFPSEYAPEYTELLSCSDPGEKPLRGGYLVAEYGKGTYIYTSYVWYRQLQILNPGAFRNFANMISLPEHPYR